MSSLTPVTSLLNTYDPANPSTIDTALTGAGLPDSYYRQGADGTPSYDPGTQPASANSAAPPQAATTASTSSGLNAYQQALASLQAWSATTLITAALTPNSGASGSTSQNLFQVLDNAAQQQQSAMDAGTNVDTLA